jgi:hypothetical protein
VPVDTLLALPRWVYLGLSAGAFVSLCVAATFFVATRLFPDGNDERGSYRSTETRRRAEIRQYLDAIDERFTENAAISGRTVAFYLPRREVAVTFDARTFYDLESAPMHTILVEHEMPGIALGHRLPFETPDVSFGSDTDDEEDDTEHRARRRDLHPAETAYAVLGLPAGADADDVQRAYRERVKEVHPDHSGDEEEFKRVREAYDTAKQHAS